MGFDLDLSTKLVERFGNIDFNYGVPYYRGQSVRVWDTWNLIKVFNLFRKYKRKSIKNNSGFGLTESIISIVLLSVLISYSIIFISKRQETLYRANLTSAINDEIDRDIETIKNNFLQHFKLKWYG